MTFIFIIQEDILYLVYYDISAIFNIQTRSFSATNIIFVVEREKRS